MACARVGRWNLHWRRFGTGWSSRLMASPDPRQEQVQGRLGALTSDFDRYVDAYDQRVGFARRQRRLHRQTIALRREANGVGEAIDSVDFLVSVRSTLE